MFCFPINYIHTLQGCAKSIESIMDYYNQHQQTHIEKNMGNKSHESMHEFEMKTYR